MHFEAKLTPQRDPNLKVEWYKDQQPLQMGELQWRQIHTAVKKQLTNFPVKHLSSGAAKSSVMFHVFRCLDRKFGNFIVSAIVFCHFHLRICSVHG